MRRRSGVDHERLGVPHIGQVAHQFKCVDDSACNVDVTLDAKAQHTAKRPRTQQPLRFFMICMPFQAGIRYLYDLGVILEPAVVKRERKVEYPF
ncbi:hypothetical protein JVU11DRAFT_12595 [Chiua virens]|nr:hypothetical protein JVU11DRAFT_12595 [Chiua virens]